MDTLPHEKQIEEYVKNIDHFKKQNRNNPLFNNEISKLEGKLNKLKQKVYAELTPWERVMISRHPLRPHTCDYLKHIFTSFVELHGDRTYRDDQSVVGGFAMIDGIKCVVIGQEKGKDTESRIHHNFGMMSPEGYRKALRLMKLAEKFNLPLISFLDSAGASPVLEAEERGQGWAIANNLREMSRIETPIIVVIIGEGCSGGAIGIGVGDAVGMLQHSYYSVITPEGCASILWKDASKKVEAASALKLNAENLLEFGIIDAIIPEPLGGAHQNPQIAFEGVKNFILEQWPALKRIPIDSLLEQRYLKYRRMGSHQTFSI